LVKSAELFSLIFCLISYSTYFYFWITTYFFSALVWLTASFFSIWVLDGLETKLSFYFSSRGFPTWIYGVALGSLLVVIFISIVWVWSFSYWAFDWPSSSESESEDSESSESLYSWDLFCISSLVYSLPSIWVRPYSPMVLPYLPGL
jgi:hypothetical protein